MSNVNTNKFGGALLFILGEFAAAEVEMIEDGGMEVFGEDDQGREGSCDVSINELAQAASDEIKHLKEELAKANERVKELETSNSLCAVAIMELVNRGDVEPLMKSNEAIENIVNKFAIEKKIEALESLNNKYRVQTYPIQAMHQLLALELEQLRKEQE